MILEKEKRKKLIYMSSALIALGVTFATSLADRFGILGIIFIALGGLFLIMGLGMKSP